jgi:hypothetical protein
MSELYKNKLLIEKQHIEYVNKITYLDISNTKHVKF